VARRWDRAEIPDDDSPGAMLSTLAQHPEWTEDEQKSIFDRLIERFPIERIVDAVRPRLDDLSGADAEVLLRIVEANPGTDLPSALAASLERRQDLPAERLWDALMVLEGTGVLDDHPALVGLWDELGEALEGEGSVEELVEQIEGDPDGIWLALQGLAAVEPEVRVQILREIAHGPLGAGVIEFLRLLVYNDEPMTRQAALDGLRDAPRSADLARAWADLAVHHPDASVALLARECGQWQELVSVAARGSELSLTTPRLVRSMVTAIDGRGRALIGLGASRGDHRAFALFSCDIAIGVVAVQGDSGASDFDGMLDPIDDDLVENDHPLALALLAGCLTLNGPETPPAFRYWIEQTAGPDLRPRPFHAEFPDWDPTEVPFEEVLARTAEVLARCSDWLDESPLTYELAEELQLREKGPPDPRRDAGAYRFLFEHRLVHQLERWRRMLLWMAWFWRSEGAEEISRSALVLAWQLSDAQYVVPGHPFTVQITTRSLAAAQENLARGVDPRRMY
jgi:hypothetical protein